MGKKEWTEQAREEARLYDKSILHHEDEEYDSMKEYELSVTHHDDESVYGCDDWYEPMGHFND